MRLWSNGICLLTLLKLVSSTVNCIIIIFWTKSILSNFLLKLKLAKVVGGSVPRGLTVLWDFLGGIE